MSSDLLPYGLDEGARARLLAELYDLQSRIEARGIEVAQTVERVATFRLRWIEELGALLVEHAYLRARVATAIASTRQDDRDAAHAAEQADARAQEAEAEWSLAGAPTSPREAPDAELKALYREAARRFHPDLASNDADRERRTKLMARVNAAYGDRDSDALRRLLSSPDAEEDCSHPGSDRQLLDAVAAAWRRLDDLSRSMRALEANEYWSLLIQDEQLASEGRCLLDETRVQLEIEIAELREQLEVLTGQQ